MWIHILYACSFSAFLTLPFLYKSKRKSMIRFYCNMGMRKTFRKMYTQMLVLFLLAFHFYYLTLFKSHYDLIPSSALCFLMFSHSLCEKTFHFLRHKQTIGAAMVLALVCLFVPHYFPLGFSLAVLIAGAVFYPSPKFKERLQSTRREKIAEEDYGRIVEWYYDSAVDIEDDKCEEVQ